MPTKSIYRTPEGEAEIHAIYDRQLARLKLPCESLMVNTRFGNTHVLAFGPQTAPPVVVLQGGNTTSPITLSWLRPLIDKYRVYAPDTIGHPGKSAPEDQFIRETRFRHRLWLDTYSHYPKHAEAIRKWREQWSAG